VSVSSLERSSNASKAEEERTASFIGRTAKPNGFRHPVWWYRVALAILICGVGIALARGRLAELFLLTLRGQILRRDPADFSTALILLVLAGAPFHMTVRWLLRMYQQWSGERPSYWSGAKLVVLSALNRSLAARASDESSQMEEPPEALRAGIEAGLWVAGVLLVMVQFRVSVGKVSLIGLAGVIAGLAAYCLEHARAHALPNWHRAARWIRTPFSLRPRDYNDVGRPWFLAACALSALWFLLCMLIFGWFA